MTNADKFKEVFGIYATELWAMPEADFLKWLNTDRKTENSSEIPNNCKYAENPSGDVWECGCFLDTYCEHQIYDRNLDGTINIVKCGYEPKTEPQTCEECEHWNDTEDGCADRHGCKTENSSEIPNNCEDEFFREPTAEERKAVADYIDSISVPTGVNVFDLMDEPTISKMEQVEDEPQTERSE